MNSKLVKACALSAALGVVAGATVASAGPFFSHPILHKAFNQLRNARATLARATHDCGGHRVIAIQKIDAAIAETKLAVDYADAHPGEEKHR